MRTLYTCDNCLHNPSQYHELGTKVGYCLKHDRLLRNSFRTTCHFFRRKDLPFFLAHEGHEEHARMFDQSRGIVCYDSGCEEQVRRYSERDVLTTNSYDPYVHEAALYRRTDQKWPFILAFCGSRSPIKSLMSSSLTRRYVQQCGAEHDNYRLILAIANDLKERVDLHTEDFVWDIPHDEFRGLREHYLKEIKLLQLYAVQEYGELTDNDEVKWISDELNGAILLSWDEFFTGVKRLVPVIFSLIIESASKRGTFFPQGEDSETAENSEPCSNEV